MLFAFTFLSVSQQLVLLALVYGWCWEEVDPFYRSAT